MPYRTYPVDASCYIVISKDNTGCITSVNMFVTEATRLPTYQGRLERDLAGELLVNYPRHLLLSNAVPLDHAQIHVEAANFANTTSIETQDSRHWHWSVNLPSKGNNQTLLVYLNACRLGTVDQLIAVIR
jgi:hypothetical protein